MKKHLKITVYGKVQGVSYRATTKSIAEQLGIKGIVMNRENGSVYIEAEASETTLEQFLDWCKKGSENAHVEKIEKQESELKNYRNFEIKK